MEPKDQPQDDFNFDDFINPADKPILDAERAKEGIVVPDEPKAPEPVAPVTESLKIEVADPSPQEPVVQPVVETPSDLPVRAPNEPEWKYNLRVEIASKQKALETAPTEQEKVQLKGEVNGIRKQIAQQSKIEATDTKLPENYDPNAFKSDLEKFNLIAKASGYVQKSEIADVVRQQTQIERQFETVGKAENDFLLRHPDMKDQAKYDNLVGFVMENFQLQGKTYNGLTAILEMAHDTLYPSQVESKIAKTNELNKTLGAVDFTGSTAPEADDPVKREQKNLVEDIRKSSGNDFGWAFD